MDGEKRVYSVAEVAKISGVSKITIYRNAQSGVIPSTKVGKRITIPGSFVRQLVGEAK